MDAGIDILMTELESANNKISDLKLGIEQLRSQLIDGGKHEDSVLIISIDQLLK